MEEDNKTYTHPAISSPIKTLFTNPVGKKVFLKQGTWDYKMQVKHDEITLDLLERNIIDPDYIFKTTTDTHTRNTYHSLTTISGTLYHLKTVTDCLDDEYEDVVTTFIEKRLNEKGEIIYAKRETK